TPVWWHQYSDIIPDWLVRYLGLEEDAEIIRNYEVQLVHGLLQTRDYVQAVVLLQHATARPSDITRRVEMRMQRQRILHRPDAPHLWAVIDEAALRRIPGGVQVARGQLEHLLEVITLPNVTIQIMPFDVGAHPAAGGSFTILRFPQPDLDDLVF